MAEEQTGQERTEQPTERRLQEARKKGQVPRSRELNTMLSLILASIALLVLGGGRPADCFLSISYEIPRLSSCVCSERDAHSCPVALKQAQSPRAALAALEN